jgi:hypothetical protein
VSDVAAQLEVMMRRVVREELERHDEAKLERLAELRAKPGRLTGKEAERLRAYLREHPDVKADLRWRRGQTERPRRAKVETWWTDELGRLLHDLAALLDGDDRAASGPPEREGAAA